jgi:hypothetical protein
MTATLVFQIKTIPDTDGLRLLYDLPQNTSAEDIANIALHQQRQQNGTEFLPLHLHSICAISCALREGETFKIWSLGEANAADTKSLEADLIQDFFAVLKQYKPQIISWDGNAFDLPVLTYRALIHGINTTDYSALSADYLDLTANLSMFNREDNVPLNCLAKLCGFPGKLVVAEINAWNAYKAGGIDTICDDCETDVLNTYLLFLRFQLMRGQLSRAIYEAEIDLVRDGLVAPQWQTFLAAWK